MQRRDGREHLGRRVRRRARRQILAHAEGELGLDDPEPLDLRLMKFKSVSIHWEAMFTRPMFGTADMQRQHDILNEVAVLVDAGQVRATAATDYGPITAANLRRAHAALEDGHVVGKLTLTGF